MKGKILLRYVFRCLSVCVCVCVCRCVCVASRHSKLPTKECCKFEALVYLTDCLYVCGLETELMSSETNA